MSSIPTAPTDLTSDWLTGVLRAVGHQITVGAVEVSPVGTGQTGSSYRVEVRYDGETDLPLSFVAKLGAEDPEVRERVAHAYRAETAFYDKVAGSVQVPVPACYFSAVSETGRDFVLLLEDLAPSQQGDQLGGCSRAQAAAAVTALAGLHGPRWCDPTWRDFDGLVMPLAAADSAKGLAELGRVAADMFIERLGSRMAEADRATLDGYPERVAPWLLAKPERFSLLHGDYRLDNLMFAPDDSAVTVVDWQTLAVGLPARDLAYFLSTSLTPDLRRECERDLVSAYHSTLIDFGVEAYDVDECFTDYRFGVLQAPLIATLGAAFSTSTERGDEMMLIMLARACTALRELGTYALIDEEAA